MQQSNALRRLWIVLDEAITQGNPNKSGGAILLRAMKLEAQPHNLVDFFQLLGRAEEEARKLEDPSIDEYIKVIEELETFFIEQNVWTAPWVSFVDYMRARNILLLLNSLAKEFHARNPSFLVDQDYLEELTKEFDSLLREIIDSDLSKELKQFLKARIEDIVSAIRKYHIDGTRGLEQAAQRVVGDLVLGEHHLKDKDKKNLTYTRTVSVFLQLLLWLRPSPWDLIGAFPDINDYWMPRIEELVSSREQIEQIIRESTTIQEALEKSSKVLMKSQKSIVGSKEPKALPASKEASKTNAPGED